MNYHAFHLTSTRQQEEINEAITLVTRDEKEARKEDRVVIEAQKYGTHFCCNKPHKFHWTRTKSMLDL